MSETLFVIVPPPAKGEDPRVCPIHASDNPYGGMVALRVGEDPIEVVNSTSIRRRIRSGDLVEVSKADFDKAKAAREKSAADEKAKADAAAKQATK